MTQGRGDGASWVTAFMLSYSLDAYDWQYVEDLYNNQRVCTVTVYFSLRKLKRKLELLVFVFRKLELEL